MRRDIIFWAAALLVLVLALLCIVFPKSVYKENPDGTVKACECYGSEFWYGTKCVGFPTNCTVSEEPSWNRSCRPPTCAEIFDRLYEKNRILSQQLRAKAGTDVILVIDSSNSMEGDKLLAAKQAAQKLVSNLQEGERIGIISFSENSTLVQRFSDDKRNLTQAISSITVSGGTNYLPALSAAEELFSEQRRSAKRGIIFLSDGTPSDDQQVILEKTLELRRDGISLFTISFDITSDDNDTNILQRMVADQSDPDALGRWYREFTDTASVAEAFSEAWQEISNLDIITITPTFDERSFTSEGLARQGFWVMLDSLFLSDNEAEDTLCVPQMSVEATANSTNGSSSFSLMPSDRRYLFPEAALDPGRYNLTVKADLFSNHNGTCVFSGNLQLGALSVEEEPSCRVPSCDEAREMLEDFDLAVEKGATLPRQSGYGRVAILMDVSESMRPEVPEVVRGVDRLNRLLSLGDERALITFSEESHLVVPLTREKDEVTRSLSGINPHGTTLLMPALVKAGFLFEDPQDNDVIVVMTDGITHDAQGDDGIRSEARSLVDEGICLYFIGYGSELLRDKEQVSLFRDLAQYSSHRLGCGGYAYTPDSERLSSIVTGMFGGVRADNESLRIIVDRTRSSDAGSFSFVVRAVSMQTGVAVPLRSHDTCVPAPVLNLSLHRHGGEEVELSATSFPDGSLHARSPYLFPGRYVLSAAASLPIDGCGVSQSYEEEFTVLGPPADTSEGIITAAIVLLSLAIFFLVRRLRE